MKTLLTCALASLMITIAFTACTKKQESPTPPDEYTTIDVGSGSTVTLPPGPAGSVLVKCDKSENCTWKWVSDCSMVSETLVLKNQTVKLPAYGNFVLESHLVAQGEFPKGKWPKDGKDGIEQHITESCDLLKKRVQGVDCDKWYASKYVQVWTPSEGGNIGQGSSSQLPTIEQEMWSGNMMWKNRPAAGTKFLAQKDGKSVVVVVGFETGPGSAARMGGLQGEVMYYLGANNSSQIKWGRLVNQQLPIGPIMCQ